MKPTLIIITIFLSLNLFGQKLTKKVGEIEIQLINHYYKHNSDSELTKRITNRKNRPYLKMYFDTTGTLLKMLRYGKIHNTDLRLLDKIKIYQYDTNGIKSKVDVWETDYEKNLSHSYYEVFSLDSTKSKVISKKMYKNGSDSIFGQTDFWYNKKGQFQGIIFSPTYYYKREYNQKNQLISIQQIYDGKLRWDWNYTYSDNKREGIFQTYYKDGNNHSKKEIQTHNSQGYIIETEKFDDGFGEKFKIYYDNNGVINKIEYYQSFRREEGYVLFSYYDIKVKTKIKIVSQVAERINAQINLEL